MDSNLESQPLRRREMTMKKLLGLIASAVLAMAITTGRQAWAEDCESKASEADKRSCRQREARENIGDGPTGRHPDGSKKEGQSDPPPEKGAAAKPEKKEGETK